MSAISRYFCFIAVILMSSVGASSGKQLEDGLTLLTKITMPHTFTPGEQRIMMQQLDALRFGLDMLLSLLSNQSSADQQRLMTELWPGVKCIFASDFKSGSTGPDEQASPSDGYPSQQVPPIYPNAQAGDPSLSMRNTMNNAFQTPMQAIQSDQPTMNPPAPQG